ncbi:MAG: RNA polymerase sigma factor [Parcubacteria bacterium C7867-001]|nr:MAG: RNA polymerase sigma factor [Parcubacteria bacterium C7867-001]
MRKNEKQLTEAFDRHADELFRHASLRLSNRDRARDLTQDAFMKTWEYLERGGEIRELRAFLFRTLKNLIIDEYRRSKSESLEALVDTDEGETIDALIPPDETNTVESAIARLDGERALALVSELPDPYREAILLRYVDGFSPKEIANVTELTENIVSVRIHRGLKKLRVLLEQTS